MSLVMRLEIRDPEVKAALAGAAGRLSAGGNGPMRDDYRRAAARYLAFIRRRFVNASRGDGTWPDLSPYTKYKRLLKQFGRRLPRGVEATPGTTRAERLANLVAGTRFAILRDTSTLFGSLTEGTPGNLVEYQRDGVKVGTRVFYGAFHQDPTVPSRPPRREIFVQPDAQADAAITNDLANGLLRALDGG